MMGRVLPTVWLKQGFRGWDFWRLRETTLGCWRSVLEIRRKVSTESKTRSISEYCIETDLGYNGRQLLLCDAGWYFRTSTSKCPGHSKWYPQKSCRDKLGQCGVRTSYLTCLPQSLTLAPILNATALGSPCGRQTIDAVSLCVAPPLLKLMDTLFLHRTPSRGFMTTRLTLGRE